MSTTMNIIRTFDDGRYATKCLFDCTAHTKSGAVELRKGRVAIYDWSGAHCRIEVLTEAEFNNLYKEQQ